ncbi:EamA-like transporter family-domain-containing protein [Neurospora tetraspora]|uniref:EamA-like transporter family-domain-containing protein n=1 Tax=Neurospora tetraspora TaxID=94610 RepID=A0AAE0JBV8_9PEZI|nr:EamA-like transporter family-domain-containing protein [Neurospora tetraspora]
MINIPSSSSSSSSSASPDPTVTNQTTTKSNKTSLHIPVPDLFTASALRSLTTSPFSEHELLSPSFQHIRRTLSRSPSPSRSFRHDPGPLSNTSSLRFRARNFLHRNRPLFQVAIAQLFGALMNLSARLLELSGEGEKEGGMHPFQILFARMFLTSLLSLLYMHWKKIESAPWGRREVRWLLVLRGVTGFFGIFPLWYSMLYLPIAEATVITFLAPSLSGYLSHLLLKDPFTKKEQIASFVALAGVVLIARPVSFFSSTPTSNRLALLWLQSKQHYLRVSHINQPHTHTICHCFRTSLGRNHHCNYQHP